MKLPLAILDFEASSLNPDSYPIEVGLAVAASLTKPALVWSSLIAPTDEWIGRGDWERASEQVHGISRRELSNGMTPSEVTTILDKMLQPIGHAWCDGGRYDGHWLKTLYLAAGTKPKFHLWDIAGLFLLDRPLHNRFANVLAATVPPHRAGEDASRVCAALIDASRL